MCTGNREKGASVVEFALVLPVLMMILFGIIEFSFILYDKAIVTNASREGARRGIVFRGIDSGVPTVDITGTVADYCANYLVSLGNSSAASATTVTGNCAVPGSSLTVTVSYPYSFLVLPNFVSSITGNIILDGTTVMRCENQ